MPTINRTPWNALVDDDGTGTVGTPWTKDKIKTVILDPADAAYAAGIVAQPAQVQSAVSKTSAVVSTQVMLGCGAAGAVITPTVSGRLLVTVTGYITTSSAPASISLTLQTGVGGTGQAPATGAPVTGTTRGMSIGLTPSSAVWLNFALTAIVTGLSVGTAYWMDLAIYSATGNSITLNINTAAIEF
jgi:hypothetical protein